MVVESAMRRRSESSGETGRRRIQQSIMRVVPFTPTRCQRVCGWLHHPVHTRSVRTAMDWRDGRFQVLVTGSQCHSSVTHLADWYRLSRREREHGACCGVAGPTPAAARGRRPCGCAIWYEDAGAREWRGRARDGLVWVVAGAFWSCLCGTLKETATFKVNAANGAPLHVTYESCT